MGLMANIPAVEAAQALVFSRAISIAFGDGKQMAATVYAATGSSRLAQKIEIDSMRQAR